MALTDKVFPLRMNMSTFERLKHQSFRSCMTVTAYIRTAFYDKLAKDEATEIPETPVKKKEKR